MPPNTACTRLVGVAPLKRSKLRSNQFRQSGYVSSRPPAGTLKSAARTLTVGRSRISTLHGSQLSLSEASVTGMSRTHLSEFGKCFLLASIPGALLPVVLFIAFMPITHGTRRDVMPSFDYPIEGIAFIGFIFYIMPIMLVISWIGSALATAHTHGLVIPMLDALSQENQDTLVLALGLFANVLLWMLPVSIYRAIEKRGRMARAQRQGAPEQHTQGS